MNENKSSQEVAKAPFQAVTKETAEETTDVKYNPPPYKCNLFYPGAGFDGAYIPDLQKSFEEAGLENAHVLDSSSRFSGGTIIDAGGVLYINANFDDMVKNCVPVDVVVDHPGFSGPPPKRCIPINLNHIMTFPSGGTQLNFMGYSYGALVAAINAMQYTNETGNDVDHLVLLAAPILYKNLATLRENQKIKKILIHDLTEYGDAVYAGISDQLELIDVSAKVGWNFQYNQGEAHFYYAKEGEEGNERRRSYAKKLREEGLH